MLNIDAIHMREINMPLAHPFETSFGLTTGRRILLIELESDGLTAWGECVAGEHPYFSDETVDQDGNWSIWAWPALTCSCRVLSLGTSVQVTLFR